ncbi:hypothetical protein A7L55_18940 [Acinetobacter baumannii]|nr:hypothetical protein A7L55_18940 [Acinetobacter baumannii]
MQPDDQALASLPVVGLPFQENFVAVARQISYAFRDCFDTISSSWDKTNVLDTPTKPVFLTDSCAICDATVLASTSVSVGGGR